MGFKCGIVGLPNVGKSTLFNALTSSKNAQAANFPFCTIDPNIGIVDVPDDRINILHKLSKSKKNKTKRAVSNEGKISTSHFEVIDEYENCTKLKIQLITGRNHQIRSQMEYLGNPILNDVLYSAKKVESLNKDQICLMSKKLKFNHKSNNYEFEATEPDFFNALINV